MSGQWGNLPCLCRQQIRKHFLREKIKILALQERHIRWFKVLQSLLGWLLLSRGSPGVPEKMASVLQGLKRETDWKTTKEKWKSTKFAAQKWKKKKQTKQNKNSHEGQDPILSYYSWPIFSQPGLKNLIIMIPHEYSSTSTSYPSFS